MNKSETFVVYFNVVGEVFFEEIERGISTIMIFMVIE